MAKILVVDDDSQLRSLMKQILEKAKHEVVEASNGNEAMEVCSDPNIELVISDLIMPGKDGLMTIQEMMQARPRLKIIAISGGASGNAAWLPIAKKAGAMRIMRKPFNQQQLMETVNETLESLR